jgi:hypothetical protein
MKKTEKEGMKEHTDFNAAAPVAPESTANGSTAVGGSAAAANVSPAAVSSSPASGDGSAVLDEQRDAEESMRHARKASAACLNSEHAPFHEHAPFCSLTGPCTV